MAETYITLPSLKHYDEKIKEVVDGKQDQLIGTEGQIVSFDADGNVISKDLEKIEIDTSDFVTKEEGKGLFSGSYNDLTDKPEIPSVEGLASEDYVDEKFDSIVGEGASTTLDTIGEISKAIEEHQEVTDALNSAIGNKVDKISGKGLSTNDLTSTLKSNYDSAYTHSQSTHAPTTAEKNVIVGIQKNGTDLSVNSSTRKVNITVPTKTSELTNDSGFKTTDNNTTYSLSKSGSTITLTGSDGSTTSVTDSNTTYSNFVKSGSSAKAGLVPAPSTTAGTTKYLREDGTWTTPPDTNTTYSTATQSAQGLMSASDKTKLDGIATGANAYTLPTASSSTLGGVKTTSTVTSNSGYTACPIISGVPYYKDSNTDTKVTNTLNTTTKAYITGTTSASTNTGTQVFDTGVYLGTDQGQLILENGNNKIILNADVSPNGASGGYGANIDINSSSYSYGTMLKLSNSGSGPGMGGISISTGSSSHSHGISINHPSSNSYSISAQNGKSYIATIYSNSSAITTSDREKKTDIQDISDKYEELFFKLHPRLFKFKDGTSGRIHIGAIAQEVEEVLNQVGISDTEFAGFVRQEKEYIVNEETGEITQEEGYDYYLRYEEFVMLLCHMLQKLYTEKEDQDNKISDLEERLASLETKFA